MTMPTSTTTTAAAAVTPRLTQSNALLSQQNHSKLHDIHQQSIDVPMKKYPPLPDISLSSMTNRFYRTETVLPPSKKQVYNHFSSTQRGQLLTLNKHPVLPTVSNVMDLDEDLPQCYTNPAYRAATYTSPGDRIISPIKRPAAPSPPTSAQIKRLDQPFDDDSQLFNEHFYHYPQPMFRTNHRIDHYHHTSSILNKHPTITLHDRYDELTYPLDSYDFET